MDALTLILKKGNVPLKVRGVAIDLETHSLLQTQRQKKKGLLRKNETFDHFENGRRAFT